MEKIKQIHKENLKLISEKPQEVFKLLNIGKFLK